MARGEPFPGRQVHVADEIVPVQASIIIQGPQLWLDTFTS
jgi:hypothetical protein